MSEENNATQAENAPAFRMQKMFLKDLSFENPNAPGVFLNQKGEPKVEINLAVKNKKLDDEHWEVSLAVTAKVANSQSEQTLFLIEIEHAGIFLLRNIPEEHLPMVLAVDCPTLLFPFTRQIISQVSLDGGFMPFLMEPVNFHAIYQSQQQKAAQQQAAQTQ